MTYDDLYRAWYDELKNSEIQKLPSDFFSDLSKYLKRLEEEGRMLDKATPRARVLEREMINVKRMVHDLLESRYAKLAGKALADEEVLSDHLTAEEKALYSQISPSTGRYRELIENIEGGYIQETIREEQTMTLVRFLGEVPAIIGVDMESYGPFEPEDIASVPSENAKILLKRGLAERIRI